MKKLKLTNLAKDEIKKKELRNICGGNVEKVTHCKTACYGLSNSKKREVRRVAQ